MRKFALILVIAAAGAALRPDAFPEISPPHYRAAEIRPQSSSDSHLFFARPVAINYDAQNLYVLDLEEDGIKVFAKTGDFKSAIGREGQGPGEFEMPTDLDILDGKLYVADSGNSRIQIFESKGRYLASFRVPFSPHRLLALDPDRVVVLSLPSGLGGPEKVLFGFDGSGRLLWKSTDSFYSGDSVYDLMRNRLFIRKDQARSFFLIPGVNDRLIQRLDRNGGLVQKIELTTDYPFREISIPGRNGQKKSLLGLCWSCAVDGGKIFLMAPERTEDGDLGPGRQLTVISLLGQIEAYIDLPERLTRFAVEKDRLYGFDLDYRLRFFSVEKK
jgi:hypothetical protein